HPRRRRRGHGRPLQRPPRRAERSGGHRRSRRSLRRQRDDRPRTPDGGAAMIRHLEGRAALVTGGTAGIGLATGLALGGAGAHVYLTHRWGSHDEAAIQARFAERGATPPTILEADAVHPEDTARVMETIRAE